MPRGGRVAKLAMDFFEHQDAARRKTGRLIALLVLAVLAITALVFAVVVVVYVMLNDHAVAAHPGGGGGGGGGLDLSQLPWLTLLGGTAAGVLLVVGGGSLYKISQLAGGGKVVARSLGGRPVASNTTDPDERKLLNVVEEMAIASGTPVPGVYLLDQEEGINAFAAGWGLDDAVIGVTRGGVRELSRDELQGVIAHEFSHILHGDMRINLRLVGLIFGILVISVIGGGLVRTLAYSGSGRSRRSNGRDNQGAILIALFLAGVALYVIGYVGVFFGRLIQAAVSRQREFLADASAVQYTRNPQGIGDALRRIGGLAHHSRLQTAHASEHRHLFFGSSGSPAWLRLFATHPPLEQRIARVLPKGQRGFLPPRPRPETPAADAPTAGNPPGRSPADWRRVLDHALPGRDILPGTTNPAAAGLASAGLVASAADPATADRQPDDTESSASAWRSIGQLTSAHVRRARELIQQLPPLVYTAAQTPVGAQAAALALLLDRRDSDLRQQQIQQLRRDAAGPVVSQLEGLADPVTALDPAARLPLLDLCLPALRALPTHSRDLLLAHADRLIDADGRRELFEWTLRQLLGQHLRPAGPRRHGRPVRLRDATADLSLVLQTLAHAAGNSTESRQAALDAARQALSPDLPDLQLPPPDPGTADASAAPHNTDRLADAIDRLRRLAPLDQRAVVRACAAAIAADRHVTPAEAELLRAVAESLGVPIPPLLPGQSLV